VTSVSAFNITDPSVCPKCSSSTMESKLMSGEPVRFCTNCRVVMALPE
jgi:ribosomal protein S27AE